MLDAFDRARDKARTQKVEAFHGEVAEAEFRKWLGNFLPKRYGVTPGYVVSTGLGDSRKTPHFDVIIYDQLESPVLWVRDSADASSQGTSLAIPVEHVRCVIEVKASLSPRTAGEAVSHLGDLVPLMGGPDDPSERYKLYLPKAFCCGAVFFDLKQEHEFSEAALDKLMVGFKLRGFFGGIILRGEGDQQGATGHLQLFESEKLVQSTIGKGKGSLLTLGMKSVKVTEDLYLGVMLSWAEMNFSRFAFDLLAMMQGTYEVGRLSSFYGVGGFATETDG